MYYILEAVLVGIYTVFLYLLLSSVLSDNYKWFLFILGFLKHLSGDLLQIDTYYCNKGDACSNNKENNNKNNKKIRISDRSNIILLIECIGEGIFFYLFGFLFYFISSYFINHKIITTFLIGFCLHILFEIVGIHSLFCKYRCSDNL